MLGSERQGQRSASPRGRPLSPRRRPHTARASSPDSYDVDNMVSRLTRPNTATANKAVLWSVPRMEYEENLRFQAILTDLPGDYQRKYTRLQKTYPEPSRTASAQELRTVIARLTKPTKASEERSKACLSHRECVERIKTRYNDADVGYKPIPLKSRDHDAGQDGKGRNYSAKRNPEGARTHRESSAKSRRP